MRYGIGLDIGIASTGYAVMELNEEDRPVKIIRIGSRVFNKPENPKDGSSLAAPRREARGMRRRLRRKAHRKLRIYRLLENEGMLTVETMEKLYNGELPDIYELRVQALGRLVTREEFARILIHLSQRRGFKSNRRGDAKDAEAGKLLKSVNANKVLMEEKGYRTVAEMFANDNTYKNHKRNKQGNYLSTVSRDLVLEEVRKIFGAQREYGNTFANEAFEKKYTTIWESQRSFDEGPGGESPYGGNLIERMLGDCTFEKGEKRAPKASYSFELSNLLQKVNNIRLSGGGTEFSLDTLQRSDLVGFAHNIEKVTFKKIRKLFDIPTTFLFNHVRYDKNKTTEEDILAQEDKTKFEYLKAYHAMRLALKEVSPERIASIMTKERNEIARVFSLYKNDDRVKEELEKIDITPPDRHALASNLGSFSKFGNLSVKALDKVIPFLEEGLTYDKACEAAGYNFKGEGVGERKPFISLAHLAEETQYDITSPVARRSLSQCAKVINGIIREMDGIPPAYINIELAREMAKTHKERQEAEKAMDKNRVVNEGLKNEIKERVGFAPKPYDIVKLKLWKEQDGSFGGKCPYCLKRLEYEQLFDIGYADVDHIIPYSDSFNDTYNNKVVVHAACNRQKGNKLPMQYLSGEVRDKFVVLVNQSRFSPAKKRTLLKAEITGEDRESFTQRNLQDTQMISRFMYNYLRTYLQFSPLESGRERNVTAVNGAVTAQMRKRLGIQKIREEGDKHHAIDAAVIACTTQGMIHEITRYSKYKETRYLNTETEYGPEDSFPEPYPNFVSDLESNLKYVFVSRAPERNVTGAAHKETIKGVTPDGGLVKKVALETVKLDKDGEISGYYRKEADPALYEAITQRLLDHDNDPKKAFVEPLVKPGGDGRVVSKIKILEKSTLNVPVHKGKGRADNDSQVRTDVYYVEGKGGGYYLVPVYVADTLKMELPNKAIVAAKPYEEWPEMKEEDFLFSLYPNDLVWLEHKKSLPLKLNKHNETGSLVDKIEKKGEYLYFKGVGIGDSAMVAINHDNSYEFKSSTKTLVAFEKWEVDVLGNISKIGKEPRKCFTKSKEA